MDQRITHFTIVGGGSAGWLTAAMLVGTLNRRNDGPDTRITLIESPTVPIVGVGEATTLSTFVTFAQLRIDERDFLCRCDASFKGAVRFRGWDVWPDGTQSDFYHPFDAPETLWGIDPAYHYHRRARRGEVQAPFDHTMSAVPWLMDAKRAPREATRAHYDGLANYTFHLDATLLGEYLRGYCTALGVENIRDDVTDLKFDERGFVTALTLEERGDFPVEFVIDCSGFRGLILRQALKEPFASYGDNLLCDRALALQVPHEPGAPLDPYTTSTALSAGWSWRVPLYSRLGTGYVYSSRFISDDQAIDEFRRHLGKAGETGEPRVLRMNIGRLRRSWVNNCLAVGLSGGFVEPLESTSIHLTQIAVRRLIDHLPDRRMSPALIDRYNKSMTEMFEDIRDFIAMHYAVSNRPGAFWEAARSDAVVPARVKERLLLWRCKMPSPLDIDANNPLFTSWSYIYVLYGKRFFDGITFPIECAISDADYDEFLAEMARERDALMARAPDHRALLQQIHAEPSAPWYKPEPVSTLPGVAGA